MAWTRFKVPDCYSPLATLATTATPAAEITPSVAEVATVAGVDCDTEPQTVATVATVAGARPRADDVEGVPPMEVATLFERIVGFLLKDGRSRPEAERDALPVLHARLANDPRLMPFTKFSTVCAMCGGDEGNGVPLLPILSSRKGTHIWLHMGDCHQQHRGQHAERVAACIAAAGLSGSKLDQVALG